MCDIGYNLVCYIGKVYKMKILENMMKGKWGKYGFMVLDFRYFEFFLFI